MPNLSLSTCTWTDVGNAIGLALGGLAVLITIVALSHHAVQSYRAAYRRRIIHEAREMVRLMAKARKPE